jgi:hypothetical protein
VGVEVKVTNALEAGRPSAQAIVEVDVPTLEEATMIKTELEKTLASMGYSQNWVSFTFDESNVSGNSAQYTVDVSLKDLSAFTD